MVGVLLVTGCAGNGQSLAARAPDIELRPIADETVQRAEAELEAGRIEEARRLFQAAATARPGDVGATIGLAETFLALGDAAPAERLLDSIAGVATGRFVARVSQGRGVIAMRGGRRDDAFRHLTQAVAGDDRLWRAWISLGRLYSASNQNGAARDAFRNAEKTAPYPSLVLNDLGMTLVRENRPAEALEHFRKALVLDPDDRRARTNLRIAQAMMGRYDAATSGISALDRSDVLNNVGYVALKNGDYAVAEDLLREAVESSPTYHEVAIANLDLLSRLRGDAVKGGATRLRTPDRRVDPDSSRRAERAESVTAQQPTAQNTPGLGAAVDHQKSLARRKATPPSAPEPSKPKTQERAVEAVNDRTQEIAFKWAKDVAVSSEAIAKTEPVVSPNAKVARTEPKPSTSGDPASFERDPKAVARHTRIKFRWAHKTVLETEP